MQTNIFYKATRSDATAKHGRYATEPYQLGQRYEEKDSLPRVGVRGFHATDDPFETLKYFDSVSDALWEVQVDASKPWDKNERNFSFASIVFVRRLSPKQKSAALSGLCPVFHAGTRYAVEEYQDGKLVATQWLHKDGTDCRKDWYDQRGFHERCSLCPMHTSNE